ncbi:hypothetical protein LguiB_034687 [Lonicera macranthoides]
MKHISSTQCFKSPIHNFSFRSIPLPPSLFASLSSVLSSLSSLFFFYYYHHSHPHMDLRCILHPTQTQNVDHHVE